MQIVKHYKDNDALRSSFNALAGEIFGLNFEAWYQRGFWTENYDPYSVVIDGKVVANVSVNRTDMMIAGERKRLIQLGTVMTDPAYRNRGFIRAIMDEIQRDYPDVDGAYLFASDSVVKFYPKFGFQEGKEFLYTRMVEQTGDGDMTMVIMDSREGWDRLEKAMKRGEPLSACAMADNPGLIFFYVAGFMTENVFYSPSLDAWVIAELEEGRLLVHNVFAPGGVTLDDVISRFGAEVKRVELGFAPADASGWERTPWKDEDCTFFVMGASFGRWEEQGLRIPSLSHA